MKTGKRRIGACLAVCAVLIGGVAAGCGGDDEPTEAKTVAEQVTVTAGTDPVATETGPAMPTVTEPSEPSGGDVTAPSDEELDQAAQAMASMLGIGEEQARCLVQKSAELSEGMNTSDPSALLAGDGLRILQECNIDLADLMQGFGGTR